MQRFYIGDITSKAGKLELVSSFWLNDERIVHQVIHVLRMRAGDSFVLFDGKGEEVLYKIEAVDLPAVHLKSVTHIEPLHPTKHVTLAWGLLKKDKSEWVVQKATELGVTRFLPMITDRTEKTGFDYDRMKMIAIEASEQCGRHTIPDIHEPQSLHEVIGQFKDNTLLMVANMGGHYVIDSSSDAALVLVGPEGGWSDAEIELFNTLHLPTLGLGNFTLRAETAAIAAVQKLV